MIQAEARAQLARFREALTGAGVLALGFYWAFFTGGGLLHWVGYAVALIGVALLVAGIQRARFRQAQDGPGIVQVVEGRIAYFGPLDGGIVDLETLSALDIDPSGTPAHWILRRPGEPPLAIPLTAQGADSLFDAFAALPDIRTEHMLRAMRAEGDAPVPVWRAPHLRERTKRLH